MGGFLVKEKIVLVSQLSVQSTVAFLNYAERNQSGHLRIASDCCSGTHAHCSRYGAP